MEQDQDLQRAQLNQAFAQGGEQELEQAVALYGHQLFHYCFSVLCDYHEAQDAAQATFIKAYRKRSSYRGEASLSTWLTKIAYHTCLDMTKKKKAYLFFHDLTGTSENLSNQTKSAPAAELYVVAQPTLSDETLRALKTLTPQERALLYGRACEERSYEELSQIFHKSAAALRQQYQRTRHKLLKELPPLNQTEGGASCETNSTAGI